MYLWDRKFTSCDIKTRLTYCQFLSKGVADLMCIHCLMSTIFLTFFLAAHNNFAGIECGTISTIILLFILFHWWRGQVHDAMIIRDITGIKPQKKKCNCGWYGVFFAVDTWFTCMNF